MASINLPGTVQRRNLLIRVEEHQNGGSSVENYVEWFGPTGRSAYSPCGVLVQRMRYIAIARFHHDLRMFSPAECTPLRLRI
jgi:hypothetical protein